MALSSNTLTHFTREKEALFGILQGHFKIFFCKEVVRLTKGKRWSFYTPMVSFCDIPMSEIKDHIKKYGSYGIGLTKEWAMRNGLNPVLYVASNSALSASYRTAMRFYLDGSEDGSEDRSGKADELLPEAEMALADVLRYMKNYEGPLERKSEKIENYRFSDEREWRYVPPYSNENEMFVARVEYEKNPETYSDMYDSCRLEFTPDDIKYIIINDDSEIREIINHLRNINGVRHSLDEIERLTTRILTTEQIKGDF